MSARLFNTNPGPVRSHRRLQPAAWAKGRSALRPSAAKIAWETAPFRLNKADHRPSPEFPSTASLLTGGGDARIVCGPSGKNQYGCSSLPDAALLAYGSSTASTISSAGFGAADALRKRLKHAAQVESPTVTYERELDRVRRDLTTLCRLEELPGLEIIFGASGTDLHLFASQLMINPSELPPLIIRVEAAETGRGVPDALAGCHFSDCAALGDAVVSNSPLDCGRPIEILEVKCRTSEGCLRPAAVIDAEVEEAVVRATRMGRRVLVTLVDVSKTGLLAPSPACVDALRRRFPGLIEVLVDACQFRLAASTLRAYLEHDFIVAITGSKFVTGPTFCGALLVPSDASGRLKTRSLPRALKAYSARADWPRKWSARKALNPVANLGLLLRWEAALAELRAFRELPDDAISDFLEKFAQAVTTHLGNHPAFALLSTPALDRGSLAPVETWDRHPTIFSFLLRRQTSSACWAWLTQAETKRVHELLRASGCQVGQPVACGIRDGVPVSALRLCLSSRLIIEALCPEGRGSEAVTAEARAVLDQAADLASLPLI